MDSLLIPRNITALLQTIRDSVNNGYRFWNSGTIHIFKAQKLCEKFDERYGVLLPRHKRAYRKKQGKANAYIFMYPQASGEVLDWLLIASEGKGKVHELEKLRAHDSEKRIDRLHIRHYEIATINDRMTWRLRREVAETWEKQLIVEARKKDSADLKNSIATLCNFPMFTGVRHQINTILQKVRRTEIRHNHANPLVVPFLPVMKRITIYEAPPQTLQKLVDRYRALTMATVIPKEKSNIEMLDVVL